MDWKKIIILCFSIFIISFVYYYIKQKKIKNSEPIILRKDTFYHGLSKKIIENKLILLFNKKPIAICKKGVIYIINVKFLNDSYKLECEYLDYFNKDKKFILAMIFDEKKIIIKNVISKIKEI